MPGSGCTGVDCTGSGFDGSGSTGVSSVICVSGTGSGSTSIFEESMIVMDGLVDMELVSGRTVTYSFNFCRLLSISQARYAQRIVINTKAEVRIVHHNREVDSSITMGGRDSTGVYSGTGLVLVTIILKSTIKLKH